MAGNQSLRAANKAKQDEFYTQLDDISNELKHYHEHFRGKVVFCNCDDPYESNFFKYFALNFNSLGLKRLIATCYDGSPVMGNELLLFGSTGGSPVNGNGRAARTPKTAYKVEISEVDDYNGDGAVNLADVAYLLRNDKNVLSVLKGDDVPGSDGKIYGPGDFRSKECVELLKQADIVCTNPPFSLFREYVAQLMKYEKKFLIIGNQNNVTYKEIFPLLMQNKIWLGYHYGGQKFEVPLDFEKDNTYIEKGKKYAKFGNICWFTNLDHTRRHDTIDLFKPYNPSEYKQYDNYDAIDIPAIANIPCDYDGAMGVPITFLCNYNPDQFEILGITDRGNEYGLKTKEYTKTDTPKYGDLNRRGAIWVNGELKSTFAKLLIRRRR
ncbi:MAG: adenine-specific methyltransferase EcoRI family protein [Bacteroidales bacterium]|nr:adenine-specific methyltransferase EcoRI family protein [Bacteroidales bacterium]